jgi:hypothetical protein
MCFSGKKNVSPAATWIPAGLRRGALCSAHTALGTNVASEASIEQKTLLALPLEGATPAPLIDNANQ